MPNRKRLAKYVKEYTWSNIFTMIRNNSLEPRICSDAFQDRTVIITGATSGIGYVTARKYASQGAKLLIINRNQEKTEKLVEEIQTDFGTNCDYRIADFSILDDAHRIGTELAASDETFDVIIHNAGIFNTKRIPTSDGLETVFVVNYLSSFIVNYLLMDKLKAQHAARILMVNSEGHRFAAWGLKLDDMNWESRLYTGLRSYGSAKTAQLLSMIKFNELFAQSNVTINAMHPGAVKTHTGKDNGRFYQWYKRNLIERNIKNADISAEALYYLGVSKEIENVSGKFFNLTTLEEPAPPALDREEADKLWEISLCLGRIGE